MKSEFQNGILAIILETKEEAELILQELIQEAGFPALNAQELRDWDLKGGETLAELDEWVKDYVSDLETEKAEGSFQRRNLFLFEFNCK